MNSVEPWLRLFVNTSCYFRHLLMLPWWNEYTDHQINIWDSLSVFLGGYAFERQGRSPDYCYVAVDALNKYKTNSNPTARTISDVWSEFGVLMSNKNMNVDRNPLYQNAKGIKISLIEFALSNLCQSNISLTAYLSDSIKAKNDIAPAFDSLKTIRGIGDKIASLFMRDLVDIMSINLNNVNM